jgi:hypothetical protein
MRLTLVVFFYENNALAVTVFSDHHILSRQALNTLQCYGRNTRAVSIFKDRNIDMPRHDFYRNVKKRIDDQGKHGIYAYIPEMEFLINRLGK